MEWAMGAVDKMSTSPNHWSRVGPGRQLKGDPDEDTIPAVGAGRAVVRNARPAAGGGGRGEVGCQGQSQSHLGAEDGGVSGLRRQGGEEGARAGQGEPEIQGQDLLLLQP